MNTCVRTRESISAGNGLRPRYIAVAAARIAAGHLAVKLWTLRRVK